MYDILQLNDMLVPELLDIAEQLKIPNAKKLNKQDLIYKLLISRPLQPATPNLLKKTRGKKRIVKASTANSTEEAIVESGDSPGTLKKKLPEERACHRHTCTRAGSG